MIYLWIIHSVFFCYLFYKLCDYELLDSLTTRNYYFPSSKLGQSLFNQLISFRIQNALSVKEFNFVEYKYFTNILIELVVSAKKFGTPIASILPEIKKALSKDINFERKIKSSFLSGLMQMFFVSLFGFCFAFMAMIQLGIRYSTFDFIVVGGVQFLGFITFSILFAFLKNYHFKAWEAYIKISYELRTLSFAGMPLSKIYEESNFETIPNSKKLNPFRKRFLSIFENIKKYGELKKEEYEITVDELWLFGDFQFEEFLKHLAALKLLVIILFFMGSYLYLLYLLMQNLNL